VTNLKFKLGHFYKNNWLSGVQKTCIYHHISKKIGLRDQSVFGENKD